MIVVDSSVLVKSPHAVSFAARCAKDRNRTPSTTIGPAYPGPEFEFGGPADLHDGGPPLAYQPTGRGPGEKRPRRLVAFGR